MTCILTYCTGCVGLQRFIKGTPRVHQGYTKGTLKRMDIVIRCVTKVYEVHICVKTVCVKGVNPFSL